MLHLLPFFSKERGNPYYFRCSYFFLQFSNYCPHISIFGRGPNGLIVTDNPVKRVDQLTKKV